MDVYNTIGNLSVESVIHPDGTLTRDVSETLGGYRSGSHNSIVTDFAPRHRLHLMRTDYMDTSNATGRVRETYAALAKGDFALSARWKDTGEVTELQLGNTVGARETVNFLLGPFLLKALPTLVEQFEKGQQLSIDVRGDIFEFPIPVPGKDGHLENTGLKQDHLRALAVKLREADIREHWSFPQRLYRPPED